MNNIKEKINISDVPINPLLEKWYKEFPKKRVCILLDEKKLDNFGCLNCDKCPDGKLFKVPKEDLEEYKKYLEKLKEYNENKNNKNKEKRLNIFNKIFI